jgi:hypothetical protein
MFCAVRESTSDRAFISAVPLRSSEAGIPRTDHGETVSHAPGVWVIASDHGVGVGYYEVAPDLRDIG